MNNEQVLACFVVNDNKMEWDTNQNSLVICIYGHKNKVAMAGHKIKDGGTNIYQEDD